MLGLGPRSELEPEKELGWRRGPSFNIVMIARANARGVGDTDERDDVDDDVVFEDKDDGGE